MTMIAKAPFTLWLDLHETLLDAGLLSSLYRSHRTLYHLVSLFLWWGVRIGKGASWLKTPFVSIAIQWKGKRQGRSGTFTGIVLNFPGYTTWFESETSASLNIELGIERFA